MVVDEEVVQALGEVDRLGLRVFVASCAERFSQVFCLLRASDTIRAADVDHFVETLIDLWDTESLSDVLDNRRSQLVAFPELQPNELGFTKVEDVYSFYSVLVTMYAVESAGAGSSEKAVRSAHAALNAMGQLDQNVPSGFFFDGENDRQLEIVRYLTNLGSESIDIAEVRAGDQVISRHRGEVILARVAGA